MTARYRRVTGLLALAILLAFIAGLVGLDASAGGLASFGYAIAACAPAFLAGVYAVLAE